MAKHKISCASIKGFDPCDCGIEERRQAEYLEPDEDDRGIIGHQVQEGYTSGKFLRNGRYVSWELKTEVWKD